MVSKWLTPRVARKTRPITDTPRFWLYTLTLDRGMTLHIEGVCLAQRRKSPRWTGPLTLRQVRAMHPDSFYVCDRCLSGKFTASPRWRWNATARRRKAVGFSSGIKLASDPSADLDGQNGDPR